MIGVVVPDVADPRYGDALRAAEAAAGERCFIAAASSDDDPEREGRLAAMMFAADVDGLLVVAAGPADEGRLASLARHGRPVVYLERSGRSVVQRGMEALLARMSADRSPLR